MDKLFNCGGVADKYFSFVKEQISLTGVRPMVKLYIATDDEGGMSYSRIMTKKFEESGIFSELIRVSSPKELEQELIDLHYDDGVTGGFVFYPINFQGYKDNYFMRRLPEFKDIEGLSANNVYRLAHFEKTFDNSPCKAVVPCTPKAVIKVLTENGFDVRGKDVVIINKSYSLGTPLRRMFDNLGATVVACDIHTKPKSIDHYLKNADIVISAVPKKVELFDDNSLKDGVAVIDVSFEGNFDPNKVSRVASKISSKATQNYIGPVTTAMAALNTLYLFQYQAYLQRFKF